jgi:hypothetical protein
MADKFPFLQVIHSIGKFFDRRAGQEINNSVIGFVGERTKFWDPHPVILPVRNAWAWSTVMVDLGETEADNFYQQASEKRGCWVVNNDTNRQQVWVPRMVFLPTPLAEFMLKERRTPWELQVELKRLAAATDSGVDKPECEVLLEWLLVASQSTSPTTCSPVVQMVVSTVQTQCQVFAKWAYYRLESTLGPKREERQATQ